MKDKKMSISTEVAIKPKLDLKEPPMYKVVYMNDNKTSMQFVIESLVDHFGYVVDTADRIATIVHEEGAAVAAVLPYEVAEQKGIDVTVDARKQGYPLQIRIEKEEA
jgi:ATP-dependent Clp protease adaptor protein ClpS